MSKRVRGGGRTHHRPGTRPPSERTASPRVGTGAEPVSELEIAEIVAQDIVDDRPAAAANVLEQDARTKSQRTHHKIKAGSLLAARAATEYVYVAQDMRRIIVVASALFLFLFVLWVLIVGLKVIPLPFY